MRIRTLAVVALLVLPAEVTAQTVRPPARGREGTPLQPAPLSKELPAVSRGLAYKRSRWSAEGYSFISSFQVPTADGGVSSYTAPGVGTRASYRYSDAFSATVDLTSSFPAATAAVATAEVGTRYSPMTSEQPFRPYVDIRAAYLRTSDVIAAQSEGAIVGGTSQEVSESGRSSRGYGAVAGAGLEFSLTRSISLTTELTGMRNRMTVYRLTGPASIPGGNAYWMTSFRYALGFKFNPGRALQLAQNAAQ
ncbi:MAG: hypothetical protein ABJF01_14215 [bacterium]